jgi:2'-hydroxyisoflavone reductase
MHLLILGGTVFLGKHLASAALARGHRVTLFNRGKHNPDLFPEAEKLRGDRTQPSDLDVLKGRKFDAAIDTCGYVPRIVRHSAEILADTVERYCFISSVSVYKDFKTPDQDESAPVDTLEDTAIEEVTGETYGPLKALCETAVETALPSRTLNIRPGLIVGPDDPTDRFAYWPHRIAQGGEVLAPGKPDMLTQFIDVRDLAEWNLHLLEQGKTGVYNATGPEYPLTFGSMLEVCREVSGSRAELTWVEDSFLETEEVQPWSELPLWIPESQDMPGFSRISIAKAEGDGLTFRPLAETVRDTLAWDSGRPQEGVWKNTLTRQRETALLEKWRVGRSGRTLSSDI